MLPSPSAHSPVPSGRLLPERQLPWHWQVGSGVANPVTCTAQTGPSQWGQLDLHTDLATGNQRDSPDVHCPDRPAACRPRPDCKDQVGANPVCPSEVHPGAARGGLPCPGMGAMEPCSQRLAGGREGDRSLKSQALEFGLHLQVISGTSCLTTLLPRQFPSPTLQGALFSEPGERELSLQQALGLKANTRLLSSLTLLLLLPPIVSLEHLEITAGAQYGLLRAFCRLLHPRAPPGGWL